ncbi:hypothetical protein RRG08_038045 [Elysia crispata]|uniref:Uncharacterized protein n=1 Tax=Elysia crispata TaxID=231223 RepID=A0AAE1DPT3_9GAST|nr:hypothetical protein RRG08_038045 [Elysia crispata]
MWTSMLYCPTSLDKISENKDLDFEVVDISRCQDDKGRNKQKTGIPMHSIPVELSQHRHILTGSGLAGQATGSQGPGQLVRSLSSRLFCPGQGRQPMIGATSFVGGQIDLVVSKQNSNDTLGFIIAAPSHFLTTEHSTAITKTPHDFVLMKGSVTTEEKRLAKAKDITEDFRGVTEHVVPSTVSARPITQKVLQRIKSPGPTQQHGLLALLTWSGGDLLPLDDSDHVVCQ